jgi:hypothetical protein
LPIPVRARANQVQVAKTKIKVKFKLGVSFGIEIFNILPNYCNHLSSGSTLLQMNSFEDEARKIELHYYSDRKISQKCFNAQCGKSHLKSVPKQ